MENLRVNGPDDNSYDDDDYDSTSKVIGLIKLRTLVVAGSSVVVGAGCCSYKWYNSLSIDFESN